MYTISSYFLHYMTQVTFRTLQCRSLMCYCLCWKNITIINVFRQSLSDVSFSRIFKYLRSTSFVFTHVFYKNAGSHEHFRMYIHIYICTYTGIYAHSLLFYFYAKVVVNCVLHYSGFGCQTQEKFLRLNVIIIPISWYYYNLIYSRRSCISWLIIGKIIWNNNMLN